MPKYFSIIIFALFMFVAACETRETGNIKDVTQSEIYQDLSFTSDGSGTNVKATLSFAGVRGTTLKLTAPSNIVFNGQPLDEKTGQYSGTYYETNFNSVLSGGTFTFTDTKGKTYTNKVELPAIDFKAKPTQINRAATTKLPIENGSKIAESSVNLKITYQDKQGFQSKDVSVIAQKNGNDSAYFDSKTQSIVIEPAIWQSVKASKIQLQVTSKSSKNLQQATTIGGKINSEYLGKTVSIVLSGKNTPTSIPKANSNVQSSNANNASNVNIASQTNTNGSANQIIASSNVASKKPIANKLRSKR
jgi:hypothetical protein